MSAENTEIDLADFRSDFVNGNLPEIDMLGWTRTPFETAIAGGNLEEGDKTTPRIFSLFPNDERVREATIAFREGHRVIAGVLGFVDTADQLSVLRRGLQLGVTFGELVETHVTPAEVVLLDRSKQVAQDDDLLYSIHVHGTKAQDVVLSEVVDHKRILFPAVSN